VTVFLWVGAGLAMGEFDESAVERCAAAGVDRCVFGLYPKEPAVVDELLERRAELSQRFSE
jgi:hypothetical protein